MRSSKSVARRAQVTGTAAEARLAKPVWHIAPIGNRLVPVTVAPAALEDRLNSMDSQTATALTSSSVGMSSARLKSETDAAANRKPVDAIQRVSAAVDTGGAATPSPSQIEEMD
jgi:hypothetical protein